MLAAAACQIRSLDPGTLAGGGGTTTGNALVKLHFADFAATQGSLWEWLGLRTAHASAGALLSLCVKRLEISGASGTSFVEFPSGKLMRVHEMTGGYGGLVDLGPGSFSTGRLVLEDGCGPQHPSARLTVGASTYETSASVTLHFQGGVSIGSSWTSLNLDATAAIRDWMANGSIPGGESPFPGMMDSGIALPISTVWNASDIVGPYLLSPDLLTLSALDGSTIGRATTGRDAGRWYFEITATQESSSGGRFGVADAAAPMDPLDPIPPQCWVRHDGSLSCPADGDSGASAFSGTTVIGIAVDLDNLLFYARINGTWFNREPGVVLGYSLCPVLGCDSGTNFKPIAEPGHSPAPAAPHRAIANFGQEPFESPPPAGYEAGW